MNKNFINIKVDREERPDVDKLYMTFIQATRGRGGWPMSVWLTPELRPIYGGTYFPPEDKYYGMPGFKTLLNTLSLQWKSNRSKCNQSGDKILTALTNSLTDKLTLQDHLQVAGEAAIYKCYEQLDHSKAEDFGGFGSEPKFPQPTKIQFLSAFALSRWSKDDKCNALKMCTDTLQYMAHGGICDHLGKGFARYSTDNEWHIPHFEKMLYDQAQLVMAYLDVYWITHQELYSNVAEDILTYVSRDLTHKSGGFYSAEDADSLPTHSSKDKTEGAFYAWTESEILSLLTASGKPIKGGLEMSDVFCHHFGVKKNGNVDPSKDAHGELTNLNVLIVRGSVEKTAEKFNLSVDEVKTALEEARVILFDVREKRPRPHKDTKLITAWNGLMISAYAQAGSVLNKPEYVERAERAAEFVIKYLYDEKEESLLRSCYGEADEVKYAASHIKGFADDYAFLIAGFIDLYQACYNVKWIEYADKLQKTMNKLFYDKTSGGYFRSPEGDKSIVLRIKDDQDGAEPTPNSVAVHNLIRLGAFLNSDKYKSEAKEMLCVFKENIEKVPISVPEMMRGFIKFCSPLTEIVVTGDPSTEATQKLLHTAHSTPLNHSIIILNDGNKESILHERLEVLGDMSKHQSSDEVSVSVCIDNTCQLPVSTVDALKNILQPKHTGSKSPLEFFGCEK